MRKAVTAFLALTIWPPLSSFGQTKPQKSDHGAPAVRVPFVGCNADGQAGPVPPPAGDEKVVSIDPNAAGQLAFYESAVSPGVLAPRGWFCFGVYGSGGSETIVTPEPIGSFSAVKWPLIGPVVELDDRSGETSGRFEVAEVIARVFPAYKAFVQSVIEMFDSVRSEITYGPYPTDHLTYKGTRTVEYRTPPNTKGLGTLRFRENDDPIEGVAILEGETPDLSLLSVRLPPEMEALASPIIQNVEREANQPPR